MKILNENGRWWKGVEREWAFQDSKGKWWIYKNKKKDIDKMVFKKGSKERSAVFSKEYYIILALASALGISVGLNIVAILA
tara:strand:- start:5452 stop:5694 length:243 start_codon:yes stop_codon:yes gene_type:complete